MPKLRQTRSLLHLQSRYFVGRLVTYQTRLTCSGFREENQAARQKKHLPITKSVPKSARTAIRKSRPSEDEDVPKPTSDGTASHPISTSQDGGSPEASVNSMLLPSLPSSGWLSDPHSTFSSLPTSPLPCASSSPGSSVSDYESDSYLLTPETVLSHLPQADRVTSAPDSIHCNTASWPSSASSEIPNALGLDFYPPASQTFEQSAARCMNAFASAPAAYTFGAPYESFPHHQQLTQAPDLHQPWRFEYNPWLTCLQPQTLESYLPPQAFSQNLGFQ